MTQIRAGAMLIATPKLSGESFEKTVVYLWEHNAITGTQGLVVNRPTSMTVEALFDRMEQPCELGQFEDHLLWHGGPMTERAITMLHTSDWYSENTKPITPTVLISSDQFMFEKMSTGNVPSEWRLFAGRAAWYAGQLEAEIKNGYWLTIPVNTDIRSE